MFGESEATNDIAIDSALVVEMLIEAINEASVDITESFHALEAELRTEEYAVLADTDDAVIEEDDTFTSDDEEGTWWDRRLGWGKFIYRGGVKCLFCPYDDGDAEEGDDFASGDEEQLEEPQSVADGLLQLLREEDEYYKTISCVIVTCDGIGINGDASDSCSSEQVQNAAMSS